MTRQITVTILRETFCSESPICPKQIAIAEDPDNTYFIYKTEIAPDIATALAKYVGPGEAIGYVPNVVAGR